MTTVDALPALVVTIAIPGAGKSTWAEQRFTPTQIINLDELRERVCDDPTDMDATPDAVAIQDLLVDARCRRRRLTVVDATNLRPEVRAKLIEIALTNLMVPVAVVLDVPLEVCRARNAARPRQVPKPVMDRMWQQFTKTIPTDGPVPGFAQTVRVRDDGRVLGLFGRIRPGFEQAPWLE
jgi:predicted kinase